MSRACSPWPVAGWVESRGREGGVGTPLPASGPAERPCALKASKRFPVKLQTFPPCQRLPPRGSWQNRQVLTEGVRSPNPTRENSVWSGPQAATNAKFKIFFPLKMARAKRKPFKIVPVPLNSPPLPAFAKNCIFRKFVLDNRPTFRYNRARSRGKTPHELERSWPGSSVG